MLLELFLFLLAGIICGVFFGLLPGIHPNTIVLFVPFFLALNLSPIYLITFIVALGITNSIVDTIPSILLGAPDSGNELSVLPGHKMLLRGNGYDAIKLTVVGSFYSIAIVFLLFPLFVIFLPPLFSVSKPFIYLLLIGIVAIMILTEKGNKRMIAALLFLMSAAIGMIADKIPTNGVLLLFPIFAGFFGLSQLLLGIKNKIKVPKQKMSEFDVSRKTITKSSFFGTLAGSASGFLPGVGTSEIASLAAIDKNDKSFLITLGAITTANTILSILSLWLIERSRSGLAVAIDQLFNIGFNEIILILFVVLVAGGISVTLTLILAKKTVKIIEKIDYTCISIVVCICLIALTVIFTGFYGVLLLVTCTALGIFTNLIGVKRSVLMGVLILPTIFFYMV